MIDTIVLIVTIILVIFMFAGLYRAIVGPTAADRIVAINVITTKITTIIVCIAILTRQDSFVNVALVYALIGFVATIGLAKLLIKGRLDV